MTTPRAPASTPSHTYAAGNTYLVTLTVTDDRGGTGTMQQSVTVSNAPPAAAFTSSAAGLTASFNGGGSTDSDGTIASYAWNFGDGSTGTGATPTHTYATGTTYNVTLTVTDNQGATGTVTQLGHRCTGRGHAVRDRLVRPHGRGWLGQR